MRHSYTFGLMNKALLILIFSISLLSCTSKFAQIQKSNDFDLKYAKADEYFSHKSYVYAQRLYEDVIPFLRGTGRFEDLNYKLAYSYYNQGDYINSENLFKNFTETFPSSNRAEECEFMRAYSYYKQSPKIELDQANTNKTLGLLQAFISTHPNSTRIKEANDLVDLCRDKLEEKEYSAAQLYYNLGYYKAAAISFTSVLENYPDSKKGDQYKLTIIKSYYKYAEMSIEEKQKERFEKVITECTDFKERYPDSNLMDDVKQYIKQASNYLNIKK